MKIHEQKTGGELLTDEEQEATERILNKLDDTFTCVSNYSDQLRLVASMIEVENPVVPVNSESDEKSLKYSINASVYIDETDLQSNGSI